MSAKPSPELLKAIAVTAELTGTQLTEAAARIMAQDLEGYADHVLFNALRRCRRELTGHLTVAHVIERIDHGWPTADEAWASIPDDEAASCVWTQEHASAYGISSKCDDRIAARMAFKAAYDRGVQQAITERRKPVWFASLGTDPSGREAALMEAVETGRISRDYAAANLPHFHTDAVARLNAPTAFAQLPKGQP